MKNPLLYRSARPESGREAREVSCGAARVRRGAVSLRQIAAALARRGVKTARGEDWKRCAGPERADPDELMSLNPSLV